MILPSCYRALLNVFAVCALPLVQASAQAPSSPTTPQSNPPITVAPSAVPTPATLSGGMNGTDKMIVRRDVPYADTDNVRQRLDIYLPKHKAREKSPVILFIHGGGWRSGNKASGTPVLGRFVLSEQFIGVSVGYRLTPEVKWPAPLHDCKAAVRWVKAHAGELGADPDKIAVIGQSAGGHLASLLGTAGDVKELEGELGSNLAQNSRVTCVVNFYGPQNFLSILDPAASSDNTTADSAVGMLLGGRIRDLPDVAKAASPITYVSAGDAPFLTAHGSKDPLVPISQAQQLHAALKSAGVESTLIEMLEAGHGFRSPELDSRIDQFLGKHLLGKPAEISAVPIAKGL